MSLVKVRMNTAAMFQIHDAQGKAAGFNSANRGDEIDLSPSEAKSFVSAGYATPVETKQHK